MKYFKFNSCFLFLLFFMKTCFCYVQFKLRADIVFSNRGDEVSMCHFEESCFSLKSIISWHRGPKMV